MRRILPCFCVLAGLAVGLGLVGCDAQRVLREVADRAAERTGRETGPSQTAAGDESRAAPPVRDGDSIKIASFNIQVFGTSKLGKPKVMDVLAKVVRRFDVVAIQEVRSQDPSVVPRFVRLINAEGAHYDHVIGPRLGRTSSKEQYVFIYDTSRIALVAGSVYTIDDPQDLLHREPLVARFSVRGLPEQQPFTFTLVNIHTDPDETDVELDTLDDVFVVVRRSGGEDDVILLGDLNVDERHLGELGRVPNITWAISGQKTNTRGTKSYDNILFDRQATLEYTGYQGVLDLLREFNLSMEEALEVSDHFPVWAQFSTQERQTPPVVAARPETAPH